MKIITHFAARDRRGQFAQRLRHQARLQADVRVAHVAFEFGLGDERGDRVDDDDVDRVAARQHLGDLERLFAGVGLRDQQVVEIDAERGRVVRIERVLDVDEGRRAADLLRFGDRVERERRLTAGFRTVDFDDAAARQTADAEREVERDRAASESTSNDMRSWKSPILMIEPLPNCRSICARALLRATCRSSCAAMLFLSF